jgi:hypothetical protein
MCVCVFVSEFFHVLLTISLERGREAHREVKATLEAALRSIDSVTTKFAPKPPKQPLVRERGIKGGRRATTATSTPVAADSANEMSRTFLTAASMNLADRR